MKGNSLLGQSVSSFIYDLFWLTVSALLSALAVNLIFIFTGLAPGGITGMAIIMSSVTKIPVSTMTLCISVPLLILSFMILGNSFGIKTIFVIIMNPFMMELVPKINLLQYLNGIPNIAHLFIGAIIGGILVGLAVGFALNHEGATGGTDVIAILIQHFIPKVKVQTVLFALDGIVVILSGLISKELLVAVFSLVSLLVINRVITFTVNKGLTKKEA